MEMASPGNQHCANCIGTLSFPIKVYYSGKEASDVSMSCFSIITIIVNDCWRLNEENPVGNVEPMQLVVQYLTKAAIKLQSAGDNTRSSVQHPL